MKIWIGTDIEGVSGVVGRMHTSTDGMAYEQACRWLTDEVNTVAEACFSAGATEVVVADTHGSCHNIQRDRLHPEVELINGKIASLPDSGVVGLDATFDAAFLLGYHARAGRHPGILDHTAWAQTVSEVRINGQPVGETELVAGYAGSLGVPTLMVMGDDVLAEDVKAHMPGVRPVVVKTALNRMQGRHPSPAKVYDRIKRNAEEVLAGWKDVPVFAFSAPTTLELVFKHPSYAELAAMVPLCERTGLWTVAFTGTHFTDEVYPAFCSMCGISAIAYYQGS